MATVVSALVYLLMFALIVIAFLWSEKKGLKQSLDQARADRNEAWERISALHAERIADIHRASDRLNRMTTTLRASNHAAEINNTSKEL